MQRARRKRIVIGITMIIGGSTFGFVARTLAIMQMISRLSPDQLGVNGRPIIDTSWLQISDWAMTFGLIVAGAGAVLAYVEWARWFIADESVPRASAE